MNALNDNATRPSAPDFHKQVLWLIGGLLIFRIAVLLLSPYNLDGDEAQYWAWSKDLDWGYYTKPPGIAAVIAFFTSIFGDAEWAVRIGSPILHSVTAYLIYRTARHLFSGATGFAAAAFYLLMPGVFYSSNLMTTDVPLLLCWALGLNAWVHLRDKASWSRAVQLGLALGLGFLSKYAMLFFVGAIFLALLTDPQTRRGLVNLKGVLVIAIFAAFVTPNMLWNLNHDFATLAHTADNADFTEGGIPFKPLKFLEFISYQFAVFGPVSLVLLMVAIRAAFQNKLLKPSKSLALFSIIPLLVISMQALLSKADANWAVTAYVGGCILVGHYCIKNWPRLKKLTVGWLLAQTAICLSVMAFYAMPSVVNQAGRANDLKRGRGWLETVKVLEDRFRQGHDGLAFEAIAVDKRKHFYALNYYGLPETAPLFMWMYKSRPNNNHAEITHPLTANNGPVLVVKYHTNSEHMEAFKDDFERLEALPPLDVDLGGGIRRQLNLWAGYGYRPTQTR